MRRIFLIFSLTLVFGCARTSPDASPGFQQGTETHGGDLVVAQVKTTAYRMLGDTESAALVRETVAAMPTFSQKMMTSRRIVRRDWPRPHWVINRHGFLGAARSNEPFIRAIARQMIDAAAKERGISLEEVFNIPYGSLRLDSETLTTGEGVLSFPQLAKDVIDAGNWCSLYQSAPSSSPKLADEYSGLLGQLRRLEELLPSVGLVTDKGRLYDSEFGYELDAQAVTGLGRRQIRLNVARLDEVELSASALRLLAFHEFSHFLKLTAKDAHYLYTYLATKCL